ARRPPALSTPLPHSRGAAARRRRLACLSSPRRSPAMLRHVLFALLCLLPSLKAAAAPTPYLNANLASGGTVPGTVFLRGTQARIQAGISRCLNTVPGCPSSFARSSMYFLLPPGLTYDHHTASNPMNPATCSVTAAPGGGQYVACTGGAVTGGSYSSAQLLLYVNVAVDAPL